MKKLFSVLFVLAIVNGMYAQDSRSDFGEKYDFVEVWGLENQSRDEFIAEIVSFPEGICEQSLVRMGLVDGSKIPLAFSNKIIITTREIPDFRVFERYKRLKDSSGLPENPQWERLLSAYENLGVYERQQVSLFQELLDPEDNKQFDRLFEDTAREFRGYGINLEKDKILEACRVHKEFGNLFSRNEILEVLYLSDVESRKYDPAAFIAGSYLNDEDDLLAFLPLLLRKKSGIQPVIAEFISRYRGKIDWSDELDELAILLNNPNPFQCLLVLKVADRTQFDGNQMRDLFERELKTLKEILRSEFFPEEDRSFLINFMNKYSDHNIEMDPVFWLGKLK